MIVIIELAAKPRMTAVCVSSLLHVSNDKTIQKTNKKLSERAIYKFSQLHGQVSPDSAHNSSSYQRSFILFVFLSFFLSLIPFHLAKLLFRFIVRPLNDNIVITNIHGRGIYGLTAVVILGLIINSSVVSF